MIKKILVTAIGIIMLSATAFADYTVFPPEGLGTMHTYTIWDGISWSGDARGVLNYGNRYGITNDCDGILKYGDFFAGAMTSTYGKVGDLTLVVEEDGYVYPVVIMDEKNQGDSGCNMWGHHNGRDIVEFEMFGGETGIYHGSGSYISEKINRPVYKVVNIGSIYDLSYDELVYDNHGYIVGKCIENGLGGYFLLTSPYDGGYV